MQGRNLMKVLSMIVIATILVLMGCDNEEMKKTDTEKQTKTVKKQDKKVTIASNEGKPQHEQLITVKLPPEADYINDETLKVYEQDLKKYNNTRQLIADNSITLLIGDYCYYDPVWDALECSVVIVNGTDTRIEDLSFQVSIENKAMSEMKFLDNGVPELTKSQIGNFQPNTAVPMVLAFAEENPKDKEENGIEIDTKNITIKLKNIQYKMVE
ncbi:hypothetical protein HCJ45_06015 [Listeria sp. FSL L7-1517]|uniref:hypothetical protein n=1 Tax=Listeria immobilis TaxID=2713502 RepID=UPI00164EC5C8|nr:hypothetical protein [Listeria immobilis]MBC6296664.1 hypothetical protein [Listeria immobilis]